MKVIQYRSTALGWAGVIFLLSVTSVFGQAAKDPRLAGAYSFDRGGWKYVHLEGTPEQIGYQHGYLLASEIADMLQVFKLEDEHLTKRDWQFYRDASKNMLWPHIDPEYQRELTGIAEGAKAKGVQVDVWDIVAINASIELPQYYVPWLDKKEGGASHAETAPHLAAPVTVFVEAYHRHGIGGTNVVVGDKLGRNLEAREISPVVFELVASAHGRVVAW